MFINKDKLKKIVATGLVVVTTGMPINANAGSYKIKSNDTIFDIARRFYGSGDYYVELMAYNHLDDFDLQNGMIINVPDLDELLGSFNTNYNNICGVTINYDNNGNVNGVWLPVKNGGYKFANVYGNINMNIDYNDMIFNFSDVDTSMISGVKITYSNDNVTIFIDKTIVRLNMFSYINGTFDSTYGVDDNYSDIDSSYTKYDLDKINGVDIDSYSYDYLAGMFVTKKDGSNGYVNVTGNKYSLHDNVLITTIDDIDFSKISGIGYGVDGNKVYFNMPLKDGSYDKVYVDLTSKYICDNNRTHNALRNYSCYDLSNINFDVDSNGDVIGIYIPVDNQMIYASITDPSSNYKFDYNNYDSYIYGNSISIVKSKNKIVGFGLLRRDGKYDYFGVSKNFDTKKYDKMFKNNPYYYVNNSYDMNSEKNYIISHSDVYKFTNSDTLWALCKSYYGKGSYYKQIMFFNDILNERGVVNGKTLYFPPIQELLDFYKKYSNNKSEVVNDKVKVKTM